MLKSLEKLRRVWISGVEPSTELADEIQAEIDKFYLPRPVFEDGKPADFGDEFVTLKGAISTIYGFSVYRNRVEINPHGQCTDWTYEEGHSLRYPVEADAQKKIDSDVNLHSESYCKKFGLEYSLLIGGDHHPSSVKMRHLLARQRKLDGVE